MEDKELTQADLEINEINEIRDNMVPKEELAKAQADAKKYRDALLKGAQIKESEQPQSAKELKDAYATQIKAGVSNVEGFETALKLREAVINETGEDPFMTEALSKIDPEFGERVAEQLGEILDKSEGDPNMFNALMSRNIK